LEFEMRAPGKDLAKLREAALRVELRVLMREKQ
jgi:hypothetical protein